MNHDGYAGDFPSRTKPTPNTGGAALSVPWPVCLAIPGWSSPRVWGGKGEWLGSQRISEARLPAVTIFLLLCKQAGSWIYMGQPEIIGANIQNPR